MKLSVFYRSIRRSACILILLPLFTTGCDTLDAGSSADPDPPRALTSEEAKIVQADNAFGLSVFSALSENDPGENLFISPTSISMALGMTLNGADGDTRAQMEQTLRKQGLTEDAINASYRSLIDLLTGLDPEVTLNIANSIWYRDGFEVLPAFLETNRTSFDAEVQALDFSNPASVDVINGWVDDKTNGLIDSIINEISPQAMMYLINAIYFKGTWMYEFDSEFTTEEPFYNADGTTSTLPLMSMRASLPFYEDDQVRIVDLPYGDSLYSMTIAMPAAGVTIDDLIQEMDAETWATWTGSIDARKVDLYLPRFELAYFKSLKEVLTTLGMEKAFTPLEADFSRINAEQDLYISDVLHKSFVEVNEEGTEAAAVTAVIVETTSVGGPPPVFRADHPFLFAIRERHSGSIVFIGKVLGL